MGFWGRGEETQVDQAGEAGAGGLRATLVEEQGPHGGRQKQGWKWVWSSLARVALWASAEWEGHHDQMVASSEDSRTRGLKKDQLDSLPDWLVGLVFVQDSLLLPCTQFACISLRFLNFCSVFFCQVP